MQQHQLLCIGNTWPFGRRTKLFLGQVQSEK